MPGDVDIDLPPAPMLPSGLDAVLSPLLLAINEVKQGQKESAKEISREVRQEMKEFMEKIDKRFEAWEEKVLYQQRVALDSLEKKLRLELTTFVSSSIAEAQLPTVGAENG